MQRAKGARTFSLQSQLPRLPVPDLGKTLEKLLDSARVFCREGVDDVEQLEALVDAYGKGKGKRAQEHVVNVMDKREPMNYTSRLWNEAAYLSYKAPLPMNTAAYVVLTNESPPSRSISERAARLSLGLLQVCEALDGETFEPDVFRGKPLCMQLYRPLFRSLRIPMAGDAPDSVTMYEDDGATHPHLVVMVRGSMWSVQVKDSSDLGSLERAFSHILNVCSERPYTGGMGVLTTMHRQQWGEIFAELMKSTQNASMMHVLGSAAFVVCLDDEECTLSSMDERAHSIMHGGPKSVVGCNRWYDKPINLVVLGTNGDAGVVLEHSPTDGTQLMRVLEECVNQEASWSFSTTTRTTMVAPPPPDVQEMHWEPPEQSVIQRASLEFAALVDRFLLTSGRFAQFGGTTIKQFKVSPDAFVQFSLQLAYYTLHGGQFVGTYESVTTRAFLAGRTETGRTVSPQSMALIRAVAAGASSKAELVELFQLASQRHVAWLQECAAGCGIDRHMLALRAAERELHLGDDPLWHHHAVSESSCWRLSTSQVPT